MTALTIGMVGSGPRLHAVAGRLRAGGMQLAVHDPVAAVGIGRSRYRLPADAAQDAAVLLLDLGTPASYADAVYEVGGVLETLPVGSFVLDLSPHAPSAARRASEAFARYGIGYADGLLLNFGRESTGEQPFLLLAATSVCRPELDRLLRCLDVRTIRIGAVGSASSARLVLEDAYEMTLRALQDGDPGAYGLDHVHVAQRTVRSVVALVGESATDLSAAGEQSTRAAA